MKSGVQKKHVRLEMLDLDLQWPEEVPLAKLRSWVTSRLQRHGIPLRWAITSVNYSKEGNFTRNLRVEAVVIIA